MPQLESFPDNDERTHAIIGAALEVHNQLGHGFLEAVYHEALAVELTTRAIPFTDEVKLPIHYKDTLLECTYKADFICHGDIIVETKALATIGSIEQAQVLNYLKATGYSLGLILNFGSPSLEVKRLRFDVHLHGKKTKK
jgi:GxxExxY protein